ncbi:hypothetical protein [Cohnella sp. GCM10027633]|uniref:hypothetical protein n=1 Tax=unclassified Cohnella TaxID=2636738 RepID=UPI00363D2065
MDTKKHIYIWVTKAEPFEGANFLLDGIAFDGDFGFGDKNSRSYSGQIIMISFDESVISKGEISTIHISRKGFKWVLESNQTVATPFLLTNNLTLKKSYSGMVSARLTDFFKMVFERAGTGVYPVIASNFLGILHYDNASLYLRAYSAEDLKIKNEKLFFSEWDMEIGIVEGYSES